jgi:hypothetical protein
MTDDKPIGTKSGMLIKSPMETFRRKKIEKIFEFVFCRMVKSATKVAYLSICEKCL